MYTGAALNLMSAEFQSCMRDISKIIKNCYNAQDFVLIPGSGTFGMEAVARQFATGKKAMIIRNGWFSYRWTQLLEAAREQEAIVIKAKPSSTKDPSTTYAPPNLKDVVERIRSEKPEIVFAPHVETSTGIILPDEYIRAVGQACREVDALFVLDCIASGAVWVDMKSSCVDVLISAPQKAWSGPACCGFVLLQERASEMLNKTFSTSFSLDLKKWLEVMKKYESGGFMYHTTLPTDALIEVRNKMVETEAMGYDKARAAQIGLGSRIRAALAERGFSSVAAPGFEAPGVVVVHTPNAEMMSRFSKVGVQVAAGVKFMLDEHSETQTFRVGLFGLEKWKNVDETVEFFKQSLTKALQTQETM